MLPQILMLAVAARLPRASFRLLGRPVPHRPAGSWLGYGGVTVTSVPNVR